MLYLFTYLLTSLLTYLLTPWCRVLLEKLTGLQLVKKFPTFHGTRRFITALTNVRHLSLSWASPIHSIYLHPTSWRSILILSTHLRLGLPSSLLPSGLKHHFIIIVIFPLLVVLSATAVYRKPSSPRAPLRKTHRQCANLANSSISLVI